MTIREALDRKRAERKNDVKLLVLCKGELFYQSAKGHDPEDSVYPVAKDVAEKEAEFFGVPLTEA